MFRIREILQGRFDHTIYFNQSKTGHLFCNNNQKVGTECHFFFRQNFIYSVAERYNKMKILALKILANEEYFLGGDI